MKKETESVVNGIVAFICFIFLMLGFCWWVVYQMEITTNQMHDEIVACFIPNATYRIYSVDSSFVSGNECFYFVTIEIRNIYTNEITKLHDFNYDSCENKLYYGWYTENNLDVKYGVITNV